MRVVLLLLALLLHPTLAVANLVAPLLGPAEVAALVDDPQVRIIDIRDDVARGGRSIYAAGHLPGAVPAPYRAWRGPPENPGELPAAAVLTALLQRLGIDRETHVIVAYAGIDAADFGAAARVYWTLKVAGLRKLSILHGGVRAWTQAGFGLSTQAVDVPPSGYVARIDESHVARRERVQAGLEGGAIRLLDARPRAFFNGEKRHPLSTVPGTIRGAVHFDHAEWFVPGQAVLQPGESLRRIAEGAGLDHDVPTVSFCNTGHLAATNWFVLSELLGHQAVRLYPGSMVEWSRSKMPMDRVPGRARQLWIDAQLWWKRTFN